jgi:hypothetical protein
MNDRGASFHRGYAPRVLPRRRLGVAFRAAENVLTRVFRPVLLDRGLREWFAQQAIEYSATQHKHELICLRSYLRREVDPFRLLWKEHQEMFRNTLRYIELWVQRPETLGPVAFKIDLTVCSCNHMNVWQYTRSKCPCGPLLGGFTRNCLRARKRARVRAMADPMFSGFGNYRFS